MLRSLSIITSTLIFFILAGTGGVLYVLYEFGPGLPEINELVDYEPPIMTRVHAGDGLLLA